VGENGDFQPLHPKISRNSQTVSNAATVTINHQLQICCRFLRYGSSYTHCCRALTLASARLSCIICVSVGSVSVWHDIAQESPYRHSLLEVNCAVACVM